MFSTISRAWLLSFFLGRGIRFEALQSEAGKKLLRRSGRDPDDISSVVLVEKDRYMLIFCSAFPTHYSLFGTLFISLLGHFRACLVRWIQFWWNEVDFAKENVAFYSNLMLTLKWARAWEMNILHSHLNCDLNCVVHSNGMSYSIESYISP